MQAASNVGDQEMHGNSESRQKENVSKILVVDPLLQY